MLIASTSAEIRKRIVGAELCTATAVKQTRALVYGAVVNPVRGSGATLSREQACYEEAIAVGKAVHGGGVDNVVDAHALQERMYTAPDQKGAVRGRGDAHEPYKVGRNLAIVDLLRL